MGGPGDPAAWREAKDQSRGASGLPACLALVSDKVGLGAQGPQLKAAHSSKTGV